MAPVSAADDADGPARSPLALLRDRTYGPYVVAKVASSCGAWIQNLASAVLMYELTASAFMVGAVSFAQFLGPLLFSFWAGSLADRFDRRKVLMYGRFGLAVATGALAAVIAVRGVDGFGGPPVLLITMLVVGTLYSVTSPAQHALVPALVPRRDLESALALSSAAPSIARTAGPALGAGLLLLGGPALAYAVTSAGHLLLTSVLLWLRPRPVAKPKTRPSLFGGLRYVIQDKTTGMLLLGVAAMAVGADPVVTLTPSLAEQFGGGEQDVGLMASAFGCGAVVLIVTISRLRRRVSLRMLGMVGYWITAAGLVVTALADDVVLASLGFLVSGSGYMMASVAMNTRIQRHVPEELRGRVMALWAVAWLGARPLAAVFDGALADATSVRTALLCSAVITVASSLLVRGRRTPREPVAADAVAT